MLDFLSSTEYQAAEYKRIGKGSKEVWSQTSDNPMAGSDGKPSNVIAQKLTCADLQGPLQATGKSQAAGGAHFLTHRMQGAENISYTISF